MNNYKLDMPIEFDNHQITEVAYRQVTAGDLRYVTNENLSDTETAFVLIERCLNRVSGFVDKLDATDFVKLQALCLGKFQQAQQTPASASAKPLT